MRRQSIDFAPASFSRTLERTHPLVLALAAGGLILCLAAGWQAQRGLDHIAAVDEEIGQTQRDLDSRVRRRGAPVESGVTDEQAASVNAAIRQLNLPWRDVLDAIEAGTPEGIELLTLEPDAKRSVVKIEGETQNSDAMLAYVEQLKQQPFLSGVFLIKHIVDEADGRHVLRFEIEAAWRSAGP
jgi:Tfp pilus assembly protein PilN